MAVVIGPNFFNELGAAGLWGLPFSWHPTTGLYLDDPALMQAQKDAINAVLAEHDPTKPDISVAVEITSTGTTAVSGTYSLDPQTQSDIANLAYEATGPLGLPAGFAGYPDINGDIKPHNATTLVSLYKAMRDYLYAYRVAKAAWAQNQKTAAPSNVITIP
jgi:hypothetical protein